MRSIAHALYYNNSLEHLSLHGGGSHQDVLAMKEVLSVFLELFQTYQNKSLTSLRLPWSPVGAGSDASKRITSIARANRKRVQSGNKQQFLFEYYSEEDENEKLKFSGDDKTNNTVWTPPTGGVPKFVKVLAPNSKLTSLTPLKDLKRDKYIFIKHLILPNNLLTELPDCLAEMVNLEFIDLHQNKLTCLLVEPTKANKIKYLNSAGRGCILTVLPNLKTLDLSNNSINFGMNSQDKNLSSSAKNEDFVVIGGAPENPFSSVRIAHNEENVENNSPSQSSPRFLNSQKNLGNSNSNSNNNNSRMEQQGIVSGPRISLYFPPALQRLYLNNNKITHVPLNTIEGLGGLIALDLSFNSIKTIEEGCFSTKFLANVKYLYLDYNKLKQIPKSICNLTGLVDLWIGYNQLNFLPITLSSMENIELIDFDGNPLGSMPPFLKEDPYEDPHAAAKEGGVNKPAQGVSESDQEQAERTEARENSKRGGKLTKIMKEEKGGLEYKRANKLKTYLGGLEKGAENFQKVKLMFVGDGNVGKTSLLKALTKFQTASEPTTAETFSQSPNMVTSPKKKPFSFLGGGGSMNLATDGIDISRFTINGIEYRAWDFAGQDLYQTTHQFFLAGNSVYLLLFNLMGKDSISKIDYWLHSLQSRIVAPIIIIGTHADDKRLRKNKTFVNTVIEKLKARYKPVFPNIVDVRAVSCKDGKKDGIGLKEIVTILEKVVKDQEMVGKAIPSQWIQLKNYLETLRKELNDKNAPVIMEMKKFEEKAAEFEITKKEEVMCVIQFLHSLGDLVYFGDKSGEKKGGLEDLIFLDPQWLTHVMASVVTLRHQVVREGKLYHSDLGFIWKEPKFPPSIHGILLQLLQKFEILYPLKTLTMFKNSINDNQSSTLWGKNVSPSTTPNSLPSGEVSLVPCLLSKDKPLQVKEVWPTYEDCHQTGRIYHFKFLPLGFFSRLFVRTVHLNEHLPELEVVCYWTNGIIIRGAQAKAYLEYVPEEFQLRFWVRVPKSEGENGFNEEHVKLQRLILESVGGLISGWFNEQFESEEIPCIHCFSKQIYPLGTFSLSEIELSITNGKKYIYCNQGDNDGCPVRIDQLAPDIALVDVQKYLLSESDLILGEQLGIGSFATVYKGNFKEPREGVDINLPVAIKKIRLGGGDKNGTRTIDDDTTFEGDDDEVDTEEIVEKFQELRREVMLMSGLDHPSIVALRGICMNPFIIVTEFVPHGNLYEYLKTVKRLPWAFRLKLALDVADGMEFLHSATPPIIHRDLKSPNILLTHTLQTWNESSTGTTAKIADFGLSTQLTSSASGRHVWNPTWLAPEILQGKEYNEKCDVYSFAIILWELLHLGSHPFDEYKARYPFSHHLEAAIYKEDLRPTIVDFNKNETLKPIDDQSAKPEQEAWNTFVEIIQKAWATSDADRPSYAEIHEELSEIQTNFSGQGGAVAKPLVNALTSSNGLSSSRGSSNSNTGLNFNNQNEQSNTSPSMGRARLSTVNSSGSRRGTTNTPPTSINTQKLAQIFQVLPNQAPITCILYATDSDNLLEPAVSTSTSSTSPTSSSPSTTNVTEYVIVGMRDGYLAKWKTGTPSMGILPAVDGKPVLANVGQPVRALIQMKQNNTFESEELSADDTSLGQPGLIWSSGAESILVWELNRFAKPIKKVKTPGVDVTCFLEVDQENVWCGCSGGAGWATYYISVRNKKSLKEVHKITFPNDFFLQGTSGAKPDIEKDSIKNMTQVGSAVWLTIGEKMIVVDAKHPYPILEVVGGRLGASGGGVVKGKGGQEGGHKGAVNNICKIGPEVWSCSDDGTVKIWSSSAELLQTLQHFSDEERQNRKLSTKITSIVKVPFYVWTVAASEKEDDSSPSSPTDGGGSIKMWNVRTHKAVQILTEGTNGAFRIYTKLSDDTIWGCQRQATSDLESRVVHPCFYYTPRNRDILGGPHSKITIFSHSHN